MRKELDDKLFRTYPDLYRNRHQSQPEDSMHWGFCHGDGWYHIVDVISLLLSQKSKKIAATQVKEKCNKLCFYYDDNGDYDDQAGDMVTDSNYFYGVVSMGERIAGMSCDVCGAPACQPAKCIGHVQSAPLLDDLACAPEVDCWPGVGQGWSRLIRAMEDLCEFQEKHNNIHSAKLTATKRNGLLIVKFDDISCSYRQGVADFVNYYAARIDENDGQVLQ